MQQYSNLIKTINGPSLTDSVVDCSGSIMAMKAKYDIVQTNASYIVIGFMGQLQHKIMIHRLLHLICSLYSSGCKCDGHTMNA